METLVTVAMGLLGAVATIYGAILQSKRQAAQKETGRALAAHSTAVAKPGSQERDHGSTVQMTIYVKGDNWFYKQVGVPQRRGDIWCVFELDTHEVYLDGQLVGSGDYCKGYTLTTETTPGLHTVTTCMEGEFRFYRGGPDGPLRNTHPFKSRTDTDIVILKPGPCQFIMGGRGKFVPSDAGYVPWTVKQIGCLMAMGLTLVGVSAVILWLLLR